MQIRLPSDAVSLVGFGFSVLHAETPRDAQARFDGGLVWLHRWNLWSESIDAVGLRIIEGLRGVGDTRPVLGEAPAHLCADDEVVTCHSVLTIPLLFQWDAYYIPASGNFVMFVSHEGTAEFLARTSEMLAALRERFRELEPVLLK